ncbi:DUF4363 family protein [Paenibacillus thiaminolyticus]|uniref:DUF4363 family protein n=1 Tax=Paenibacillus thiaminolyticus TaxID=49283 RepID=UPI0035A5A3CF
MMKTRKWIMLSLALLLLVLFGAVLSTGNFLKQPLGSEDRLLESLQSMEKHVKKKDWNQAKDKIEYASKAWKRIVNRVQFSVEREYMYGISGTLSRIRGGIEAKDDSSILQEIYFFYDLWENLGR